MHRKITRLRPTPPEPTNENPYVQLDWLRDQLLKKYTNKETRKNMQYIFEPYKKFLAEEHGYDERLRNDPRFYLSVHWDHFVIYNAERYWRSRGYSSYTLQGRVKLLQRAVRHASALGLTSADFFIEPKCQQPRRETMQRAAYAEDELEFIRKIITPKILHAQKIVAGYKPKGCGSDPRIGQGGLVRVKSSAGSSAPDQINGWSNWENMVWYFENVLRCQPIIVSRVKYKEHSRFFDTGWLYHGGMEMVWQKLGVAALIDISLMFPLAFKLAWETGLNPEAILNLKRDCLREAHPLTGLPYLRYYKERSTGEKDLHVLLFDEPNQADLHFLSKQSEIIRRTIKLILDLTEPLVPKAKDKDKNYLFLAQSGTNSYRSERGIGDVRRLNVKDSHNWAKVLLKNAKRNGENGIPQSFNLARFRPTKIALMVREGVDFFLIQAVAGHSRLSTTAKYLESLQLNEQERREISQALNIIHRNREEYEKKPKPYSTSATQNKTAIFKGILCDCKNVFDPPPSVRRLPVYKDGDACTYWNMCLTCPNVIITRKHLPVLVGYYREIIVAIEGNNLTSAPNGQHYQKVIAVLEGIFDEFDEEDVAWANEISEVDGHVDSVTYHGVSND